MADARLDIIINAKDNASGVFKSILGGLGDIAKVASGVIIGDILGGAIRSAAAAIPEMIGAASDMGETVNKVNVVFGDAATSVLEFGETATTALGMSEQTALAAAGTFGNLFTSMGIGQEVSADMSTELLTLAADLASFNNIDPTVALDKLRAGLVGETEPLRALGVNLSAAAVEAKALEMGLVADGEELTAAAKAQAAYALILEQTTNAQGDFARTSDGLANQQRILKAQLDDVKATLGAALLPVINTFIQQITAFVSSEGFTAFLDQIVSALQNVAAWLGTFLPVALQFLSDVWTNVLQPAITTVWEFLQTSVIPWIQNVLIPWLQVNIPIALQFLSDVWTNVLQPAIAAVWAWISGTLIPFFQNTVIPILEVVIPAALKFLSDAWQNVLLPVIMGVWNFLTVQMKPIWEAIGELLGVAIPLILTALAGFWENVLLPVLSAVWDFIKTKIVPIFSALGAGIGGVSNAIQVVVGWIEDLIDMLANLELPDWLTPGSPTPLELGLVGISRAVRQLASTELPRLSVGLAMDSSNVSGRAGSNMSNVANYYNLTINDAGSRGNVTTDFALLKSLAAV